MKKTFLGALGMAVIMAMSATTAFAAVPVCGNFVDANGDGVCDNIGIGCIYADADEDGLCDACGVNHLHCLTQNGKAFADENGDGICDNCEAYHQCGMIGTNCGGNFVDADGDGICDNYVPGQGCGSGQGLHCGRGTNFTDSNKYGTNQSRKVHGSHCGSGSRGRHCR